nr:hypothetical protein [Tanacetum cinerariifolium]
MSLSPTRRSPHRRHHLHALPPPPQLTPPPTATTTVYTTTNIYFFLSFRSFGLQKGKGWVFRGRQNKKGGCSLGCRQQLGVFVRLPTAARGCLFSSSSNKGVFA